MHTFNPMYCADRHSPPRHVLFRRAAILSGVLGMLSLTGIVTLSEAPRWTDELASDAGLTLLWTLWGVPVTVLAIVLGGTVIAGVRSPPRMASQGSGRTPRTSRRVW